jgi:hypothetical protein
MDEPRPGAYHELAPEPPRVPLRQRRGVMTVAALGVWAALAFGVLYYLGLAGWRFGWIASLGGCAAGSGVVVWAGLGTKIHGRGLWTAAVVLVGAVAAVQVTNATPESVSRIAQRIDAMRVHNQLWQQISEQRRGHGWCSPQCPEVIRLYRSPNNSDTAALAVALTGLHDIGLIKNVSDAYIHQYGPVITVGTGKHLHGTVTISHIDDRVTLLIDFQSGR